MMMDLERFFEEKQVPYTRWEIEHEGFTHVIDSETVIEYILISKGKERTQIGGTLFALDFKNAPIVDYLKFLAECLIKHNYSCEEDKQ